MTNVPMGPGWWQDQLGGWHPPHLHPDPRYRAYYANVGWGGAAPAPHPDTGGAAADTTRQWPPGQRGEAPAAGQPPQGGDAAPTQLGAPYRGAA